VLASKRGIWILKVGKPSPGFIQPDYNPVSFITFYCTRNIIVHDFMMMWLKNGHKM
jgi:hypothetical protein